GGRRAHSLSALALTCAGFAAIDPGAVFDLGFQLSAASVLFIAVFGRYLSFLLARTGIPRGVSEALSLTLAAQWATLPLTLPAFGTLSLVAPLANLVCGPLMSAMLVCGLATAPAAAAVPALSCLLAVPEALAQLSVFAAAVLADLPYASIPFSASAAGAAAALYLPALAVFLAWRPWSPRAVSALAGALVAAGAGWVGYWTLAAPPRVTVMDVGQADSILVRDGASSLLVDAGVDERVIDALARNRVYRLDAVVVTHWDADHWGGLPDLLAAVDVGALYVARGAAGSAPPELLQALSCEISELGYGDRLAVGGFSCRVVWPRAPVAGEENAESLVLDVRYRDGGRALSVLLTGDVEAPEAERFAPEVGDVDVLKLGHHGSAASVDASMLSVLDPEVAVASAGEGNAYGHPAPACTQAVAACGVRFLCTIDAGDVELAPAEGGVGVSAGRGAG
uniref:ComEC/Rec2 family competence protein n=1 Tax=Candidatus Collinsella stercoripullorum TaxID=2838522 RepID=UPI0022E7C8ED